MWRKALKAGCLCRCIDALIAMGVLVDGGDRVSIRRTAVFFLSSFEASSSFTFLLGYPAGQWSIMLACLMSSSNMSDMPLNAP